MIIIVMGVSGSGKTTIGQRLASALGWNFVDADSFHSQASIEKMSHGVPLTNADRLPWLQALRHEVDRWLEDHRNVVLACSALKASYRQTLLADRTRVKFVYLKGALELFQQRLAHSPRHFMPEVLLKSQFDILEEPAEAVIVDADTAPDLIVETIRASLNI